MSQEIKDAIDKIEHLLIKHRHTHTDWLEYLTKKPEEQTRYINIEEQKIAIADYDEALKALAILKEQPPASQLTKDCRKLICNWDRCLDQRQVGILCDRLDKAEAKEATWEKQKCGKGFNGEGVTCDNRHADIGHYVTHYRRAKQIIEEQTEEIKQLEAKLKEKDELLFAYESVNAPVNPLLSINKKLLEACKKAKKRIKAMGYDAAAEGTINYIDKVVAKAKQS